MIDRKFEAFIKGIWHPIEILDTANIMGRILAKVRVTDGTKPFTTGTWSDPFVYSDEGLVSKTFIREIKSCPHKNVYTSHEPDGDIRVCRECGGWLDDDGFVYRYSDPLEEIY